MKFSINKILLWLKSGNIREIKFRENKINVITGDSGTGKTEIISIIDYCFFGSRADITDEIINENVKWYGINFNINDNVYTLGRGSIEKREVSKDYFFHADGYIPKVPAVNNDEKQIKKIIDKEFSITERTVFPYGGKSITLGSTISPRYFFMFNTLSGDTIDHSEIFFDKQNIDRYRDALMNIFDLAVGIETEENLLKKEKLNVLNADLKQWKRKLTLIDKEVEVFNKNIVELSKKAKELNLIDYDLTDPAKLMKRFEEISSTYKEESIEINLERINKLKTEKNKVLRKIRNLKKFKLEIERYKKLEKNKLDSLKPVRILNESYKLLKIPELDLLISSLQDEYEQITQNNKGKLPFDFNVNYKIREYEDKVHDIDSTIFDIPINDKSTKNEIDKLIFIGELRVKLELYKQQWVESDDEENISEKIKNIEEQINDIKLIDYQDKRETILRLLDELIQVYLDKSGDALDNYEGYKSSFNYKEKKLELRRPRSAYPSKVGSSSN